ncbi:LTA synthase family protein [Aerobium aerolatum]|nr:sulfatase-like hydrolase/transferase [Aquamicrobium aerolatum]
MRELPSILVAFAIVALVSRLGIDFKISKTYPDYIFGYVAVHMIFGFFGYSFFRSIFSRIQSLVALAVTSLVVYYISEIKRGYLGEPLIFNDLTNTENSSVVVKYLGVLDVALIAALIALVAISFVFLFRRRRKQELALRLALLVTVCVVFSAFHDHYRAKLGDGLKWAGFEYRSWAMAQNFMHNGIFVHLLQTSLRNFPPEPTAAQRAEFVQDMTGLDEDRPKQVIFILCESCWYDDKNFKSTFEPLTRAATATFRSVSPVSGGGTPNSTMEWMVGLPVRHPSVSGILYQEYRDFFSENTYTLASLYKSLGHTTLAAHNFHSSMWFRRTVAPLLGFDEFYDVRDLNISDEENYFPRDRHLFDAAKGLLKQLGSDPYFVHLITVHMHGPYEEVDGDLGAHGYQLRAERTVSDTVSFVDWVRKDNPEAVIVVYADHVPPMTPFFEQTGADISNVPVWVFDPDEDRARKFAHAGDKKKQFCINSEFTERYIGVSLPQAAYVKSVCSPTASHTQNENNAMVPGWVFFMALFDRG